MVYPWSKKEEEVNEAETEIEEEKEEKPEEINEDNLEVQENEGASVEVEKTTEQIVDSLILNILKLEGYKMDSGELFQAFKEAGGEMENFKSELDKLSELGKIKSDSDGNIMTTEDYKREKSQSNSEGKEISSEENNEDSKESTENVTDDETKKSSEKGDENELESIIKLKEETDSWLIDKLKNNGNENDLRAEVQELKERVGKLEKVIKNLTRAFE